MGQEIREEEMSNYQIRQHANGMFVRNEIPADDYVIGEIPTYEQFRVGPGDRVLDLGANIGAMSQRFLSDGADLVVSVEPFPDNVIMLRKNLAQFDPDHYEILQAAVVGVGTGEFLELHTPDTNFGMISRVRHDVPYAELTGKLTVPTVQFQYLLGRFAPTAIKCDIEGGEWDLFDDLQRLPAHVTRLAIEMHHFAEDIEHGNRFSDYVYLQTQFQRQGFRRLARSGAFLEIDHSAELSIFSRE